MLLCPNLLRGGVLIVEIKHAMISQSEGICCNNSKVFDCEAISLVCTFRGILSFVS